MSESSRGLAWDAIKLTELRRSYHRARADPDTEPLSVMFARIVYIFGGGTYWEITMNSVS
ncbi:hypothetical protein QM797_13175 [Rhodococcus sp. IEGM 1381]|uniref:hypothetical protein n=1 Tax=Rhodococcus sp. IEGM 1381 TaxID=3047085 RepID=UPI0024B7D4C8|nr:hypothetical protein [Rhodococcus sp. IEGM 1381]MDI9895671.1 hypothetical protein [Rhodococcus sp. IEGM 1381]